MRDRKQIESDAAHSLTHSPDPYTRCALEVLLDIRDMLMDAMENQSRCPHGRAGLCMPCVIQFDLLRPRKE